jgi:hypothetical protein
VVAAAPSVTPIVIALVVAVAAFGAFLPSVVRDSRRPLPPPRPVKVKPVKEPRPVAPPLSTMPLPHDDVVDDIDDAHVPVPARRAALALGVLGLFALWTTVGARTRRAARR